ncbi:MAG: hydroxymyristoyl-ACP dehydratase [Gammaproteobacteria bacterium]|nr:MAG: hydroxymyristoyl-ACP dehydratase [Gammaproteobacteria bacterium]
MGDDHPSLPGHFPDQPIVPGVVLLDRVAAALSRWRGRRIAALTVAKFIAPVLPLQALTLTLREDSERYRFEFVSEGRLAASGTIETVRAA